MQSREWPVATRFKLRVPQRNNDEIGLCLPIDFPTEYLDLSRVEMSIDACVAHLGALELVWQINHDRVIGSRWYRSILKADVPTGDTWSLMLLERTSMGRHLHNEGAAYGELIITLGGELHDVLDNGVATRLDAGSVAFHAPGTFHEATAPRFWAGLVHQPRGCTPA